MPSREKDQADFDLETFVDLFDTAMSSDNPAVQRALKNLLMIAAIVNAEDPEAGMRQGPLRRVLEDQKNIASRLSRIENEKVYTQGPVPHTPGGFPHTSVPLGPYYPPKPLRTTWHTTDTGFGDVPPPDIMWVANTNTTELLNKLETK
jgi:hypothetical protein